MGSGGYKREIPVEARHHSRARARPMFEYRGVDNSIYSPDQPSPLSFPDRHIWVKVARNPEIREMGLDINNVDPAAQTQQERNRRAIGGTGEIASDHSANVVFL